MGRPQRARGLPEKEHTDPNPGEREAEADNRSPVALVGWSEQGA